jgi:hypothetical protein
MAREKKAVQTLGSPSVSDDRRRSVRVRLTGAALISRTGGKEGPVAAVLDNVNRVGAGLHAKAQLKPNESVTVALAFLDQNGDEQQEKLVGKVAWTKPWEKGYLIGVVWDNIVTKERNRWLYLYLDETLRETA